MPNTGHTLFFTAPYQVTVQETPIPTPAPHQLLIQAITSGISAGTELLLYRGQMPADIPLDTTIPNLTHQSQYPTQYGYMMVGHVIAIGKDIDPTWQDQRIFTFHPHQSHFLTQPDQVWKIPANLTPQNALFLPNMETAVSFLMDSQPTIGENVVILGQGIVGLLTTALLAPYPLSQLLTIDHYPLRRQWSQKLGATTSLSPHDLLTTHHQHADLTLELSGNPQALNTAIQLTGYSGRILIGSWYGQKQATLHLGGQFHRSHIQLITSQVSQLHPRWRGRWDKTRRLQTAWHMLQKHQPHPLITHTFPLTQAPSAYTLLDQHPDQTLQVVFTY